MFAASAVTSEAAPAEEAPIRHIRLRGLGFRV